MKLNKLLLAASLAITLPLSAADKNKDDHGHDHGEKIKAPNGGRVLTKVEPHAEFFITADRKVQITFIDDDGKPLAPADQVVTVTTGDRAKPTKLAFEKAGAVLLSTAALPEGNNLPTVVQIKEKADAKAVTEKFNLNLSNCPGCKHAEYACACEDHEHAH